MSTSPIVHTTTRIVAQIVQPTHTTAKPKTVAPKPQTPPPPTVTPTTPPPAIAPLPTIPPAPPPTATPPPAPTVTPTPSPTTPPSQAVDYRDTVASVTGTSFVLLRHHVTVVINGATAWRGQARSLAQLQPGMQVEVQGILQSDGTVLATAIITTLDD